MVANKTLKNLYVDIQGSGIKAQPGDSSQNRIITVRNRGDRAASIELWLEPTDEKSKVLMQWTKFDRSLIDLELEAGKTQDINLEFRIPRQAKHGFYSYNIRARSDQYPGEEVRRSQQLQVLPSNQELVFRNQPKIIIEPETNSENPCKLIAGNTLKIKITITNPSRRTDRFSLSPLDLEPTWYDIEYPEQQDNLPGEIRRTEALELNPKESGEILIDIHPPQYALAGNYIPTFQIHSNNRDDLVLFEIVYLEILVSSHLEVRLTPDTQKIPSKKEKYFELSIFNSGNIDRHVQISPQDIDEICKYKIKPSPIVNLLPGEDKKVQIFPYIKNWRKRYFFRLDRSEITFVVDIKNNLQFYTIQPVGIIKTSNVSSDMIVPQSQWVVPDLPNSPTGKIVIDACRGLLWKLFIGFISLLLLTGAAVGISWLIWMHFFWRPSLQPRILTFESSEKEYQEGINNNIKLSFEITNPEQIGGVIIYQGQPKSKQISASFEFKNSKDVLENKACDIVVISDESKGLLKPLFNLHRRFLSNQKSVSEESLRCIGVPIETFLIEKKSEEEDVYKDLNDDLTLRTGKYSFTLAVLPNNKNLRTENNQTNSSDKKNINRKEVESLFNTKPLDTAFIKSIEVAPPPPPAPPEIFEFVASAPEYRLLGESSALPTITNSSLETNLEMTVGADDPEEENIDGLLRFDSTQNPEKNSKIAQTSVVPIRLNWKISNASDINKLELVSISPDGVENTELITYENFQWSALTNDLDQIDPRLRPYCSRNNLNQLICNSVPVEITKAGKYTFRLTVTTNRDDVIEDIIGTTSTILVKEPSPEILNFQVNGEKVLSKPKFVYPINPARVSFDIELTWAVQNAVTIELLPAPGEINLDAKGLIYTISATPGSETLTLRAVNEIGEEVTRSVVIEKVEFTPLPVDNETNNLLPPPPPPPTLPDPSEPGGFPVYPFSPQTD